MHGSNTLGSVDGDKQEMNTMSECQVKAVRGSEKSMMEPLESMKEGGTGELGGRDRVGAVREMQKEMHIEKRMDERERENECRKA